MWFQERHWMTLGLFVWQFLFGFSFWPCEIRLRRFIYISGVWMFFVSLWRYHSCRFCEIEEKKLPTHLNPFFVCFAQVSSRTQRNWVTVKSACTSWLWPPTTVERTVPQRTCWSRSASNPPANPAGKVSKLRSAPCTVAPWLSLFLCQRSPLRLPLSKKFFKPWGLFSCFERAEALRNE